MTDLPLITTITAAFTAAWILGLLAQRFRLSPIVGYLLAGVLIGPYTPGFVGNAHLAHELAEVGVILLMFGVGQHFHWKDLWAVRRVAIPGALGQTAAATAIAMLVLPLFGLSLAGSAVLGLSLAVASTVVLMRLLMSADRLHSAEGHVAVGWLLVEDVLTVVVLVLIPALKPGEGFGMGTLAALGISLLKLGLLVIVVAVGGARVIPWILVRVARLRSRELFTLTVLVCSIAVAAGSYAVFGASMALGAFLAGMVVAQSAVSHQVAADILPLRDAFSVLFFVAVGMLFDPAFVLREPGLFTAVLAVILIVKPLAALILVRYFGHSPKTAITVAVGLGQIGEFSFILSEVAQAAELMPAEGHHALVGAAIVSITVNSLLATRLGSLEAWLRQKPGLWKWLTARMRAPEPLAAAVDVPMEVRRPGAIVVGFGPIGQSVDRLLREAGVDTMVVDLNADAVSEIRRAGQKAIFGDAANGHILAEAGLAGASHLIVTLPHTGAGAAVVATARHLNPTVRIHARARYLNDRGELEHVGATAVIFEEVEAAAALARVVLLDAAPGHPEVERSIEQLRNTLLRDHATSSNIDPH